MAERNLMAHFQAVTLFNFAIQGLPPWRKSLAREIYYTSTQQNYILSKCQGRGYLSNEVLCSSYFCVKHILKQSMITQNVTGKICDILGHFWTYKTRCIGLGSGSL